MVSGKTSTVLIVEDDPGVASLQRRRLERAGYATCSAATPQEAVGRLAGQPVDLILLDYRLPGDLDGLSFFAQLRADGHDVPVILVTGFSNEATAIAALRAGVRDFVTKSVEYLDYLPEAVGRVLNQVHTERQLADSEARLAGIIRSAKDGVIVTDAHQRITLFNPAAEAMFGCRAAEALGQPLDRFVQKRPVMPSGRLTPGDSFTEELQVARVGIRSSGQEFPLDASVSRIEVAGQKYHTVLVRDVTERARGEARLRESEQRFRNLADRAPVYIWLTDQHGGCTYLNRSWLEFTGRTPEQDLDDGWLESVHPDDRDRCRTELRSAVSERRHFQAEYRVRRHDGEYRWLLDDGTPRFDADGSFIGLIGSAVDITSRREAEEQIRQQAALLDQANDAIFVHDISGRILFWSRGAERLYGWTQAEAMGRIVHELLHKNERSHIADASRSVLADGQWSGEFHHARKDGHEIVVASRWTLVRDDEGRPKSILAIETDITEKKKLEEQFLHAQRLKSVGTLASGIAHDFNNMLTVISGYSFLLLGELGPQDPCAPYVEQIQLAGKRAAALTGQLLAFGRKQVLDPKVFDVNEILADTQKMLLPLIGENIALITRPGQGPHRIKADRGQLEQALVNLAINARDAMSRGGTLSLETARVQFDETYASGRSEVTPGRYILLAVSDTGCGMDAQTQARLFEPFFTTKAVGKGTGLGLAAVYGIVRQSGGHVSVYSEVNVGTTFKIFLPEVADELEPSSAAKHAASVPSGKETILVVEDDTAVRTMTRVSLERFGYTVLAASGGQQAIEICERHPGRIDLLATDVIMPDRSGQEVADWLRALRPDLKVLFLSGYTDDAAVRHGVLQPDSAFLQKPFTPAALAAKVREVLDRK